MKFVDVAQMQMMGGMPMQHPAMTNMSYMNQMPGSAPAGLNQMSGASHMGQSAQYGAPMGGAMNYGQMSSSGSMQQLSSFGAGQGYNAMPNYGMQNQQMQQVA